MTHTYTYEFEIEEFLGVFLATVYLEFEYEEGEKEVRYTANGDGYPGSPASVTPVSVLITMLEAEDFEKTQVDLDEGGWQGPLGELALEHCCDEVDRGGPLRDELFDVVSSARERY